MIRLREALQRHDPQMFGTCLYTVISDALSLDDEPAARKFGQLSAELAAASDTDVLAVLPSLVDSASASRFPLPDVLVLMRDRLATALEHAEQPDTAAAQLTRIPSDASLRFYDPQQLLQFCVRAASLFLQVNDLVSAENHITRSLDFARSVKESPQQSAEFKEMYGLVLERKGRFLEASFQYLDASRMAAAAGAAVDRDVSVQLLERAAACGLLAPASGKRLSLLKDVAASPLQPSLKSCLLVEKATRERILREADAISFLQLLETGFSRPFIPTSGKSSLDGLLRESFREHNILVLSRTYITARPATLAFILGGHADAIERTAAKMIVEERLGADIDQQEDVIRFHMGEQSAMEEWSTRMSRILERIPNLLAEMTAASAADAANSSAAAATTT